MRMLPDLGFTRTSKRGYIALDNEDTGFLGYEHANMMAKEDTMTPFLGP